MKAALLLVAYSLIASVAIAPAQDAQPAPVAKATPSDADIAFASGHYEDAERLYSAMSPSDQRTAGIVRSILNERRLDEALTIIEKENAAHPNDALLLDVLGEVRFRRGEVVQAAEAYNKSVKLDPTIARTHYDMGRFMNLNGLYLSGQIQLNRAHELAPDDLIIKRAWESTQRIPLTPEEQIARLQQRLENPSLTDDQKTAIGNSIKAIQSREKGDCQLAEPITTAKIPLYPYNPNGNNARIPTSSDMDVVLNGKRRRFKLDTGASGLLISEQAAKALGLIPEAQTTTGGIGDAGRRESFITHVENIKIGSMEFHNCQVRVLENKEALNTDGLIGADVFRNFLVTLDLPAQEIRLSPLPKRPDETAASTALSTSGDEADAEGAAALTIAQRKKDRYVAPEMANWIRVFRSNHLLIFPTDIGNTPRKLFAMDTGAAMTLISAEAAREVTKVSADSDRRVRGISGDVKNVFGTGDLAITFGNVRQIQRGGLSAIDLSSFSRGAGVELSGFIGYPLLRELVIQIDYRDNLVHLTYTPHIER